MRPPKAVYIPRHIFPLQMSLLAKLANDETTPRIFRGKCIPERKDSISAALSFYLGLAYEIGVRCSPRTLMLKPMLDALASKC
jgi:hypothetical protein